MIKRVYCKFRGPSQPQRQVDFRIYASALSPIRPNVSVLASISNCWGIREGINYPIRASNVQDYIINFSWHHQMFEPRGVGEHASSGRKATLQSWQAVASDGISIILNMLRKDDELMTLAMTRIVRMTRAVAPVLAPGPKLRLRNLGSGQWSTQSLQHWCFNLLHWPE